MKIFMIADTMDIGGAETHIRELSRLLALRGHRVTVLSAGGCLAAELPRLGVRHVTLPSLRNPVTVPAALSALARHIRRDKPHIVHAHTRRAAFLCRILQSTRSFPFVVTAHAMFSSRFPLDTLSVFPPSTIAVSPDIRRTLVRNFSVPPSHVTVIENGIDTRRFAPRPAPPHPLTVLSVSRLDRDCAHTARLLVRLAPLLTQKAERPIRIVIVGGGDAFEEIRALADAANRALGRCAVILTGNRTDVHRLLDECDVFVGVSRAALEAMSAGKPTILCGDEGYLGIVNDKSLPTARLSNFCARGHKTATEAQLLGDLLYLISLPLSARQVLGGLGRETVRRLYSAEGMAGKTEALYRRELARFRKTRRSDALICGYYGYGNCGDELILNSILAGQRALTPDLRLTALTAHRHTPDGTRSVHRYHPIDLWREMRAGGAFILGGGSLLQDATSRRSLLYYLTLLVMADRMGLPTMLYANGLGPLTPSSLALCRRVLRSADVISLRDRTSYDAVRAMKLPRTRVILGADPVLADKPTETSPRTPPFLALFPRGGASRSHEQALADAVADVAERHHLDVILAAMNPAQDSAAIERIAAHLRHRGCSRVAVSSSHPRAIRRLVGRATLIIGERLHALILGFASSVPVAGLERDPKIPAFLKDADLALANATSLADLPRAASYALSHPPSPLKAASLRARARRDAYTANALILRK